MARTTKSATPATPAIDVASLLAMVQQLQAQVATQAAPKVAKAAKADKPKATFDAKALAGQLTGKPGVIEEKTQKGRRKLTAFCADGSIVSVIL